MSNPPAKYHVFYTFLMVLVSFVIALFLGELMLRATGFEFRLYPTRIEFGWPDPVTLENDYQADRDLLWVPKDYENAIQQLRDSKPKLIFMGDSCTAWGLYDKLFDQLIQIRHQSSRLSYVNAAVAGWSSYQGLKQFERDIIPLAPEIVTIYFGWNDHWASFGVEDKAVGQFNKDRFQSAIAMDDMRLVQLFNFFAIKVYHSEEQERRPERVAPADFAANLQEIVSLAKANNIEPILITAPTSHTVGSEPVYLAERWLNDLGELVPLHRRYGEIVRQIARDERVHIIDLLDAFDRLPAEEVKTIYFESDGIHLTGEGHKIIALILYQYFARNNVLEQVMQ